MTMINSNKAYPGMICNSTEFFISDDETKIIHSGRVLPFCEIPLGTMRILEEAIKADPNIKKELTDMFPDSHMKRLEQFVRCRFGGLDFQGDITNGKLQEGEFWECPNRGKCKSEGILCKLPSYNDKPLTKEEIKLMQLTSTDMTNEVIAEVLEMPMGTFHKLKKKMYDKLCVQTKQEIVKIAFLLNII